MSRESLRTLLETKKYRICVPAIQREYVQGFDEEKANRVRKQFLDDIFDVINNKRGDQDDRILDIGIIYGYIEKNELNTLETFFPVDGQQRLTTLYLLDRFLEMMQSDSSNSSCDSKDVSKEDGSCNESCNVLDYEIRKTTRRFIDRLFDSKTCLEIKSLLKQENFPKLLSSRSWFESEWIDDITVQAMIHVLSEFKQRIDKEEHCDFSGMREKLSQIKFDLILIPEKDARKNSSAEYAKINARGKQLEVFENVKSMISIIEEKLKIENSFVYRYDTRFVDLFYDICSSDPNKNLEEITKEINQRTMVTLINGYNLLSILKKEETEEKKTIEKGTVETPETYLQLLYTESANDPIQNEVFWKEYILFLNNILESVAKIESLEDIERFSKEKIDFNVYKDKDKLIFQLLYYHHYREKHSDCLTKDVREALIYILNNLMYSSWKRHDWRDIDSFIETIAKSDDIFKYFMSKTGDNEIITDMSLPEKKENLPLNDIGARIREQWIKSHIIKDNKLGYYHFRPWEEQSNKQAEEKRSIYYLLYISEYWTDPNKGNYEKLEKYLEVAESYFHSDDMEWRRIFALAAYYDSENECMKDCDAINRGVNDRFGKLWKEGNRHEWKDEYYFTNILPGDAESSKEENLLKEEKLNLLRLAYDLVIQDKTDSLKESIDAPEYERCWLPYAITRKDSEEFGLLERKIFFQEDKLYIELRKEEKPENRHLLSKFSQLNYFAFLYILDRRKDGFSVFKFCSSIYDLCTRNVRDTHCRDNYLHYSECGGEYSIVNPFEIHFIWEKGEKENPRREIKWDRNRDFFYDQYKLEVSCNKDELLIFVQGGVLLKLRFGQKKDFEDKENLSCIFKKGKETIEGYIASDEKRFDGLKEKMKNLHHGKNDEKDELIKEVQNYIEFNYTCESEHKSYSEYKTIHKYLSKNGCTLTIE